MKRYRFRVGRSINQFFSRCTSSALYQLAYFFSARLQKKSCSKWLKLQNKISENEAHGIGVAKKVEHKQSSSKQLVISQHYDFADDTFQQISRKIDVPVWAKEIHTFLANQLSDHTRRAYETDLKQFFRFLESRMDLRDITLLGADHIIVFRKALEEGRLNGHRYSKSTINRKLAVLKSFLNWLQSQKLVRENPARWVKGYPQSQESALKGFSDAEVCRILDFPRKSSRAGALHSAILHCLFFLGLRKGELIGLKMGDLTEERGVAVMKVRGKGHRVRILPITAKVREALKHYFHCCSRDESKTEEPMFIPTKNPHTGILQKHLNPAAITYIVDKYARKVGVLKRVSPHSCRATCISNALDRKATNRAVQVLAGWSTPLMIQRYDKRRDELKNSAAYQVNYG